jgi:hypothetical protein
MKWLKKSGGIVTVQGSEEGFEISCQKENL